MKKWQEMVKASREAIEDFQDFESDKAIVYAAKQISALEQRNKELEEAIGEAKAEIDQLIHHLEALI